MNNDKNLLATLKTFKQRQKPFSVIQFYTQKPSFTEKFILNINYFSILQRKLLNYNKMPLNNLSLMVLILDSVKLSQKHKQDINRVIKKHQNNINKADFQFIFNLNGGFSEWN